LAHSSHVHIHLLQLYYAQLSSLTNATYNITKTDVTEKNGTGMLLFVMEGIVTNKIPEKPQNYSQPPPISPVPESAFVVTMAVSLPFTLAEFDDTKQAGFRSVIANVANVKLADVAIASIASINTDASRRRRLLASALRIDLRINAASSNAAGQLGATLSNASTLNTALAAAGLPAATVLVAPATIQTTPTPPTTNITNTKPTPSLETQQTTLEQLRTPLLISAAIAILGVLVLVVVLLIAVARRKSATEPPTDTQPEDLTNNIQGSHMPEFSHLSQRSAMPHGRYYPLYDQSGALTWHT